VLQASSDGIKHFSDFTFATAIYSSNSSWCSDMLCNWPSSPNIRNLIYLLQDRIFRPVPKLEIIVSWFTSLGGGLSLSILFSEVK
jgi:hypothetical protein